MVENETALKKRILGVAAGVLVLYWLIFHVFVSDETRIRRALQNSADGFNDTQRSRCISVLGEGYRDETGGFTRDQLGQMLVYLFLKEKHPDMNTFRYHVELVEDELEIEVLEGSPKTASVSVLARFSKFDKGDFKPVWDVKVEGEMEKTSDGWKVMRSRYRSVSGKAPF